MRTQLLLLIAFCASAGLTRAQNIFSDALASFNTNALAEMRFERQQDQVHKVLVLDTIAIAKRLNVRIEPEAARPLDDLYVAASGDVANEPDGSERRKLFPANRRRFIARLISFAEPFPANSLVTRKSVDLLKKELENRVFGFCPCWQLSRLPASFPSARNQRMNRMNSNNN
jgi:hypothetical protein